MSAALEVFRYSDTEDRTLVEDDEIWFVAADVCAVLEHTAPSKAVAGLDAVVLDAPQVRVTITGLTDLHRHLGGIAPIAQALGHEDGAA